MVGGADGRSNRAITLTLEDGDDERTVHYNVDSVAYLATTEAEFTTVAMAVIGSVLLVGAYLLATEPLLIAVAATVVLFVVVASVLYAFSDEGVVFGTVTETHRFGPGDQDVSSLKRQFRRKALETVTYSYETEGVFFDHTYSHFVVPENVVSVDHQPGGTRRYDLIGAVLGVLVAVVLHWLTGDARLALGVGGGIAALGYYVGERPTADSLSLQLRGGATKRLTVDAETAAEFLDDFERRSVRGTAAPTTGPAAVDDSSTVRTVELESDSGTSHLNVDNVTELGSSTRRAKLPLYAVFAVAILVVAALFETAFGSRAAAGASVVGVVVAYLALRPDDGVIVRTLAGKHGADDDQAQTVLDRFETTSREYLSLSGTYETPFAEYTYDRHIVPENVATLDVAHGNRRKVVFGASVTVALLALFVAGSELAAAPGSLGWTAVALVTAAATLFCLAEFVGAFGPCSVTVGYVDGSNRRITLRPDDANALVDAFDAENRSLAIAGERRWYSNRTTHFNLDAVGAIRIEHNSATTLGRALQVLVPVLTYFAVAAALESTLALAVAVAVGALSYVVAGVDDRVTVYATTGIVSLPVRRASDVAESVRDRVTDRVTLDDRAKTPYRDIDYECHLIPANVVSVEREEDASRMTPVESAVTAVLAFAFVPAIWVVYVDPGYYQQGLFRGLGGFGLLMVLLLAYVGGLFYVLHSGDEFHALVANLRGNVDVEIPLPSDDVAAAIDSFRTRL